MSHDNNIIIIIKTMKYLCVFLFMILSSCYIDEPIDTIQDHQDHQIDYIDTNYDAQHNAGLSIVTPTDHVRILKDMCNVLEIKSVVNEDTTLIEDSISWENKYWYVLYNKNMKINYNRLIDINMFILSDKDTLLVMYHNNIPLRKNDTTYVKTELVHEIKFNVHVEPWIENEHDIDI